MNSIFRRGSKERGRPSLGFNRVGRLRTGISLSPAAASNCRFSIPHPLHSLCVIHFSFLLRFPLPFGLGYLIWFRVVKRYTVYYHYAAFMYWPNRVVFALPSRRVQIAFHIHFGGVTSASSWFIFFSIDRIGFPAVSPNRDPIYRARSNHYKRSRSLIHPFRRK